MKIEVCGAGMEFISIDGLRGDGRKPTELRRIMCEIGSATNANGSACMSMGLSKVSLSRAGTSPPLSRQVKRLPDQPRMTANIYRSQL